MSNAIVPRSDLSHDLGTATKRFKDIHVKTVNADEATGGLKADIDSRATKVELQRVEGEIENAAAPNYYEESEAFYDASQERDSNTEILSPSILWLNINGQGRKLTQQVTLDIDDHSVWDTKATEWQTETAYALGDRVYPTGGSTGYLYKCTTAGTSSTLTPTWPTTPGDTYNDGSVVWTCELDTSFATSRAGKDFYIYACANEETPLVPDLVLSINSTVPEGYTAANSRKVGGFHCLCADVGTITDHPLSGYVAGDILPCSIWDLKHRPIGEPEGYAYDEGTDMWFSIYGLTWSGTWGSATSTQPGRAEDDTLALESKYGAEWADGASSEKFHCWKFEQILARQKQRLPYQREFMSASLGSNQSTNIYGSADPVTTGGHKDTNNRRMISNIGLEDMCGDHWQWGADVGSASTSGSYGNAYDANDKYEAGQVYGTVYRPLLGGAWTAAAHCGSRASDWADGALSLAAGYGARGASEPLHKRVI
jgi:hypothetical protein